MRKKNKNQSTQKWNSTMMWSDPLKVPDYNTPNKKKRFVESKRQMMQNAVIEVTGNEERGCLQSPFGERRQKAILSSIDRAEAEFRDFGLQSIVESFTQNELNPFDNYNRIDSDMDLRIGAALWILDKLRAGGKLHEACRILPDTAGNPDVWYLPTDFHHVCYDNDLIQSVIHAITHRFPGDCEHSVLTVENARGKEPGETWKELLNLMPEDEKRAACDAFREKLWEVAARNMKGQACYDREIGQIMQKIHNIHGFAAASDLLTEPFAQKPEMAGMSEVSRGLPGLGGFESAGDDALELAIRGEKLIRQNKAYTRNFERFLLMDKRTIRKETGSREAAEALAGFTVDDPYALCFALFYMIDSGDDTPWLMRSGCALMRCAYALLPWNIQEEDWDDEDWNIWFEGMQYNQNGWLEREPVPDQLDYLHDIHNGKNLAQIIYRLCRSVVPMGLHPFDMERQELIAEGMDADKARTVTGMAELMFLQSFQAKQFRPGEFSFDWENKCEEEDMAAAEQESPMPAPAKEEGCRDMAAAAQGRTVQFDTVETETAEAASDESQRLKAELEQAKKQIKGLKAALSSERHAADADRARYEHELKGLRMEHRELADLRSLVFNQENAEPEQLEWVEKQYCYPYETRKRTVVFGGHDSFLRVIKPMLPSVKFVDPGNLTFSADIIRNADVVWIQNNCISHSQFWNIVKNCKAAEVQLRYFGFASAEKCAGQLVTEDRKNYSHRQK